MRTACCGSQRYNLAVVVREGGRGSGQHTKTSMKMMCVPRKRERWRKYGKMDVIMVEDARTKKLLRRSQRRGMMLLSELLLPRLSMVTNTTSVQREVRR